MRLGNARRDAALLDALIAVGVPVAGGPPEVSRALLQHTLAAPALLCPALLRAHVRHHAHAVRAACEGDRRHAAALLGYCLQDVQDDDASSCAELLGACTAMAAVHCDEHVMELLRTVSGALPLHLHAGSHKALQRSACHF